MRDFTNFDRYLDILLGDIYGQPQDPGHTALANEVIDLWGSRLAECKTVLDVGCGEGFCQPMFEKYGIEYTGVALGPDVVNAKLQGRNVTKMDFNFLDYPDDSFDLVFSRHSLEHSPMPFMTLMEWHRVAKKWLGLVLPAPEHYTFVGQNHYSVVTLPQVQAMLPPTGWNPIWYDVKAPESDEKKEHPIEYWLFCQKVDRKK